MLILILIDVQHLQKAVFSFEKGFNHQNHSSGFFHLAKNSPPPPSKISNSPSPLSLFGKPAIWKTFLDLLNQMQIFLQLYLIELLGFLTGPKLLEL